MSESDSHHHPRTDLASSKKALLPETVREQPRRPASREEPDPRATHPARSSAGSPPHSFVVWIGLQNQIVPCVPPRCASSAQNNLVMPPNGGLAKGRLPPRFAAWLPKFRHRPCQ